jgi:hypothetical protein
LWSLVAVVEGWIDSHYKEVLVVEVLVDLELELDYL